MVASTKDDVNARFAPERRAASMARRMMRRKHVAPSLIGGQYTVGDQHGHRATVLGDASNRDVGRFVVAVALSMARDAVSSNGAKSRSRRPTPAVEYRQDAFEAGTGFDVLLRQFAQRSVGAAVVLGETDSKIRRIDPHHRSRSTVGPKRAPLSRRSPNWTARSGRSISQKLSSPRRWMRLAERQ